MKCVDRLSGPRIQLSFLLSCDWFPQQAIHSMDPLILQGHRLRTLSYYDIALRFVVIEKS